MNRLPFSPNINNNALASVFNSTSATYKFYWFLGIIEEVEQGRKEIIVNHQTLKCEYNATRTKEQILKDIQKRFPGCVCYFDLTLDQQTIVKISWKKD